MANTKSGAAATQTVNENKNYREVQLYRENPKKEKSKLITEFTLVKVLRPAVMITDAEAETLNTGVIDQSVNKMFSYYLLPDQKPPVLITHLDDRGQAIENEIVNN